MSLTPLLPIASTRHNKSWNPSEDQALKWAWKAGATDTELETYFGRTVDAVQVRASKLGLGRRGKLTVVATKTIDPDPKLMQENAELKGKVEKITTVFDTAIELFKTMNLELKNDL